MRRCFLLLLPLLMLGCRAATARRDVVERELHARERQVHELQHELRRLEGVNAALDRGFRETSPGFAGPPTEHPTSAEPTALRDITLGRGTRGVDRDGRGCDDALEVVVAPRDADRHTVKATGSLTVTAFQVTPEGLKQPFGFWELTSTELRSTWRGSLLNTGYTITLPFREPATQEKLWVVVRFTALSGQPFEADQTVRIRLASGSRPVKTPLVTPEPPTEKIGPPRPEPEKPATPPAMPPVKEGPELPAVSVSLMPVQAREPEPAVPTLVAYPGTTGEP